MKKLSLIYPSNTVNLLQKIVSTYEILKFSILEIRDNKNMKKKLFQTISVHKTSQLELWPEFLKSTCKRVKFW